MDGNYLIPANANRGKLIFGYFRPIDLAIFSIGFAISFVLLITLDLTSIGMAIIAILPVLVTGFLVFPLPHYHNVLVTIQEMIRFLNSRQKYVWKGWCYKNVEDSNK